MDIFHGYFHHKKTGKGNWSEKNVLSKTFFSRTFRKEKTGLTCRNDTKKSTKQVTHPLSFFPEKAFGDASGDVVDSVVVSLSFWSFSASVVVSDAVIAVFDVFFVSLFFRFFPGEVKTKSLMLWRPVDSVTASLSPFFERAFNFERTLPGAIATLWFGDKCFSFFKLFRPKIMIIN